MHRKVYTTSLKNSVYLPVTLLKCALCKNKLPYKCYYFFCGGGVQLYPILDTRISGLRSPPQELEEGPRSGPHLLVCLKEEEKKDKLLK